MDKENEEALKLFQTENNRIIEEEFSSVLTERNDIRLFFINESAAYTDGKNIVVDPAIDQLYCDIEALSNTENYLELPSTTSRDMFIALKMLTRSQNIHESLHIIYSNFPSGVCDDKRGTTKFKQMILSGISNVIEDAFIESVGASEYDNMSLFLKFNRVARLYANTPSDGTIQRMFEEFNIVMDEKKELSEDEKKANLLMEYIDYFATILLYPMVELEEPSEELKPYIEKTRDLFLEGSICGIADERYEYVDKIYDLIIDLIPDVPDSEYKNYESIMNLMNRLLGNEKTHSGKEMSIGKYKHKGKEAKITRRLFTDKNGNMIIEGHIEQFLNEMNNFKTDKKNSIEVISVKPIIKEYTGSELKSNQLHKNVKIKEVRPAPDLNMKKAYDNIYNKYKMNINSYNSRFTQLLKGMVEQKENGYAFGDGIVSKDLGNPKKRYWYRKIRGTDIPDIAILFLIDGSGSMYGEKNNNSIISSVILHEVLAKQGIEHAIVEHRASFEELEVTHNIIVDFNSRKNDKYNILRLTAGGDNRDGISLLWAEKYLEENSFAENKVIISISDGVPAHRVDNYYPPVSIKDTYNCVKKIEKTGIEIIAVALEESIDSTECYDDLKEIYRRIIEVNDLKHLTSQLLTLVSKLYS